MGKSSTKVSFSKVIQGGEAELVKSTKSLTRKDIKEFLAKFAEAVLVDQKRVDKLPHEQFHHFYDDGMWQGNREDHVKAIVDLTMTVDEMPKSLLKKLTELAIAHNPEVVKQPLLNSIGDLATGASSPWLYETASLFFNELFKEVSRQSPSPSTRANPTEMMMKWFDYDDPIAIAKDPECEYVDLLASHIKQESEEARRALAAQSRLAFIEMRVAKEFCDYLLPQLHD
jgi:hypothetical protein